MKSGRLSAISLVLALLAVSTPAFSWDSAFFDHFEVSLSARTAAIGGLHSALADDATVLFSNPAGYHSVEPRWTLSRLGFSVYDAAAEIATEAIGGVDPAVGPMRRGAASMLGPVAVSYVGNGFGLGLFNTSNIRLHSWGPIPYAREELIEENLVLIAGRAFRIFPEEWPSSLDVGVSAVLFLTARGSSYADIREVLRTTASPTDLIAASGPFQRALGAGVEFGVLYSLGDLFAVGIAGRNLSVAQVRDFDSLQAFTGSGSSRPWFNVLPLELSAGVLFRPPVGPLGRYISGLTFLADYHDIFDFLIYPPGATSPWLHIGLGAEMKLLEVLSLRGGYYQCRPSVGLGLDLSPFVLDIAYFGRELSTQPGGYPVNAFSAEVRLKL